MTLAAACAAELGAWSPPDDHQAALARDFHAHAVAYEDAWSRGHHGAHLTASSLVVSPDVDRVVLVAHRRLHRWLQTGGHIEADDADLAAAALREAREETGLASLRLVPGILQLDRHEVPCGPVRPTFHLDVRYAILADPHEQPVASDESDDVRWFGVGALPEVDASVRSLVAAARRRLRA